MPEGHTIHRLARDHNRDFKGQALTLSSPQGRFSESAALVDGQVLRRVEPYGKHLWYWFERGEGIHVHLGLYGKFWRFEPPGGPTHRQVRLRMVGERVGVDLTGPTACEVVTPPERDAVIRRLGPDPIRPDHDPERAWEALRRRRGTIGEAIIDQKVAAGVGNVYRAEALFVHGIHPLCPAPTIRREQFDALWTTLVEMLRRGVRQGRIVTVDPAELGKTRSRLRAHESRYIYRQEHCLRCGTPVRRWQLGGRWAYACERDQPPPPA